MPQENSQQDIQKKLQKKRNRELVAYFKTFVAQQGLWAAVKRTGYYLKRRYGMKKGRFLPKKAELARQQAENTDGWPTISLLVPVYQPNPVFFKQLLQSLQAQTYAGFEVCFADASDEKGMVKSLLQQTGEARFKLIEVLNLGIAVNTNAAASLATGDYIAFADHDDLLAPHAMYYIAKTAMQTGARLLYSDEAIFEKDMLHPIVGHFKPNYSPQYLLNVNYIGHLVAVQHSLFNQLQGLQEGYDGSQDHDFVLRAAQQANQVVHIPKVLYYWRRHAGSTSGGVQAKPYVAQAAKKAIAAHLSSAGLQGSVVDGRFPSTYKVDYKIIGNPLVSIIIPTYEHIDDLDRCLQSVYNNTRYSQFEIILVENNSKKPEIFAYYAKLQAAHANLRMVRYPEQGFNFSALCNYGAAQAKGEYLLFLNNDVEVIGGEWLGELLQLCQLPQVGATGAMLYYPDDTVQHAGVIVGLGGYAGHSHKYALRGKSGYMFRQAAVQELSAVTGACLLVKQSAFAAVGGFDTAFSVAYNDVDFCLRLGKAGFHVVFTPYAELYHYESKSRGSDETGPAHERFEKEQALMKSRWGPALLQDPFYNPHLTYDREDFSENDVLPEE